MFRWPKASPGKLYTSRIYFNMLDPETCWVADTRHREAWRRWRLSGGGQPTSWCLSISESASYLVHAHRDEISWCLTTMVLTIAALDSVGMGGNWMLGSVDLWIRFSSGICCLLPMDCGRMCAHLCWGWWWWWWWWWWRWWWCWWWWSWYQKHIDQ